MSAADRTQPPVARPEVLAVPPAAHGALDYVELDRLDIAADQIIDFSVNSNPFGPSPAVAAALAALPLDRYPDREALALRQALAQMLAVSPHQIVAGNGTAELIQMLALAYVRPGDDVLILGPTFGEYERACRLMGAHVHTWAAVAEDAFAIDVEAVAFLLQSVQPRLLFVCRPNNPTGCLLPVEALRAWAEAVPQTLVVVDEAYLAFAAGARSALDLGMPNILCLRSMTKDYALAGLRLGYAVAHRHVIDALQRVRPAWNVNALAQAAGLAALADSEHQQRTLAELRSACTHLLRALTNMNLRPLPSAVHFFLLNVGDGAALRRRLLRHHIQVRDCASFGLPAYVRIATRRPDDNQRLITALHEVMQ